MTWFLAEVPTRDPESLRGRWRTDARAHLALLGSAGEAKIYYDFVPEAIAERMADYLESNYDGEGRLSAEMLREALGAALADGGS